MCKSKVVFTVAVWQSLPKLMSWKILVVYKLTHPVNIKWNKWVTKQQTHTFLLKWNNYLLISKCFYVSLITENYTRHWWKSSYMWIKTTPHPVNKQNTNDYMNGLLKIYVTTEKFKIRRHLETLILLYPNLKFLHTTCWGKTLHSWLKTSINFTDILSLLSYHIFFVYIILQN